MRILSRLRGVMHRLRARKAYLWTLRSWFEIRDLQASRMVLDSFRLSRLVQPNLRPPPANKSILVIAPHPDDEIIGPGGTLLSSLASGSTVTVFFLTTGRSTEAEIRRIEAETLCRDASFGCWFAGFHAEAIPLHQAGTILAELLRAGRFDCVFLPFFLDDHDDHRRASAILIEAMRGLEGAIPEFEAWAYQVYGAVPMNCIVDITDVAGRKGGLIAKYASQMERRDWVHFALGMNAVLSRFLPAQPGRRFAEGFLVLPWEAYRDLSGEALRAGLYSQVLSYQDEAYQKPQ